MTVEGRKQEGEAPFVFRAAVIPSVYISLNDQAHAKIELEQYVKVNPKDKEAKGLLSDMEHGDLRTHIHDGPPPGVVAPAPGL